MGPDRQPECVGIVGGGEDGREGLQRLLWLASLECGESDGMPKCVVRDTSSHRACRRRTGVGRLT